MSADDVSAPLPPQPPTPDPPPPPGHGATALLCHAAALLRGHIERVALRPDALTWTGFSVLQLVVRHPGIQPQRAAAQLAISNPTLTAVIRTLVKRDLIRRHRDPHDRRCAILVPTRRGWQLAHQANSKVIAEETRLLNTPAEHANAAAHILQQAAPLYRPHPPPPAGGGSAHPNQAAPAEPGPSPPA